MRGGCLPRMSRASFVNTERDGLSFSPYIRSSWIVFLISVLSQDTLAWQCAIIAHLLVDLGKSCTFVIFIQH